MSFRIKGQEVTIQLVAGGEVADEITEIKDFEFTYEQDILQEGYLGKKSDDVDAVFKIISGKFSCHIHTPAVYDFVMRILDKATRKTPDTVFNIITVLDFPGGDVRTISLNDVQWGAMPTNIGSRADYVKLDFTFKCSEATNV